MTCGTASRMNHSSPSGRLLAEERGNGLRGTLLRAGCIGGLRRRARGGRRRLVRLVEVHAARVARGARRRRIGVARRAIVALLVAAARRTRFRRTRRAAFGRALLARGVVASLAAALPGGRGALFLRPRLVRTAAAAAVALPSVEGSGGGRARRCRSRPAP